MSRLIRRLHCNINATVFQSPVALALSSCDAIIGSGKKAPSMKIAASFLVFLTGIVHV
jgi:hypothetical protein